MEKTREQIFQGVRDCLINALGVSESQVTLESSLVKDLGAESIDFLDVVFRLEKTFGIKIPRGDLFPENLLTNPAFVKDGRITPAGLAELKRKLSHVDFTAFEDNPLVSRLSDIFTVKMIVDYLYDKTSVKAKA